MPTSEQLAAHPYADPKNNTEGSRTLWTRKIQRDRDRRAEQRERAEKSVTALRGLLRTVIDLKLGTAASAVEAAQLRRDRAAIDAGPCGSYTTQGATDRLLKLAGRYLTPSDAEILDSYEGSSPETLEAIKHALLSGIVPEGLAAIMDRIYVRMLGLPDGGAP